MKNKINLFNISQTVGVWNLKRRNKYSKNKTNFITIYINYFFIQTKCIVEFLLVGLMVYLFLLFLFILNF